MSYATARAGIGLRLCKERWGKEVKKKRFEHDFPEAFKFDPVSGNELWRQVIEYPPLMNELHDCYEQCIVKGITLQITQSHEAIYVFLDVAKVANYKTENNKIDLETLDFDTIRNTLKPLFEPHGLWDEDEFKLWVSIST